MTDVVIVAARRTPVGSFLGAFASVPAHELGRIAIEAALEQAGVAGEDVSEVILGQVLTAASAGTRPVSTYLQIVTSSLRARATMAIRLTRPVAVPTRSRYQRASALSG